MSKPQTEQEKTDFGDRDAAVYELEEIWDQDWFQQADHDRIERVISLIPPGVESLLDVGCGNGLFVNTLQRRPAERRPSRLCAVDRSATALKQVQVDSHQCDIRALPFADGEFEVVTCLEVVEHLPLETYTAALAELCRVTSRWILISVPFAQDLRASLCECPSCATRFNANYHMRSFDEAAMRELLVGHGFTAVGVEFIGTTQTYLGYNQIRRFITPPPPPAYTICPMCGYDDPEGLAAELARKRSNNGSAAEAPSRRWKDLVKRVWPKRPDPTWVAGLYEKRRDSA